MWQQIYEKLSCICSLNIDKILKSSENYSQQFCDKIKALKVGALEREINKALGESKQHFFFVIFV